MAQFENVINTILANEGGLKEYDGSDSGGITNFGISLKFLTELAEVSPEIVKRAGFFEQVNADSIRSMTQSQAIALYRAAFWEKAPFEKLMNSITATYIFDMCVNHGMGQGIRLVQRAVNACQKKRDFIKDDGVLGSHTIQGINLASFMLHPALIATRESYMRLIVALNPKLEGDLDGLINRCYRI